MTKLSRNVALKRLHASKGIEPGKPWKPFFCYATLTEPTKMESWNGVHPVEENLTVRMAKAGTRVLVTMASRFGDVGVRDTHLVPASHGYFARVLPEKLKDWDTDPGPIDENRKSEAVATVVKMTRSRLIAVEPYQPLPAGLEPSRKAKKKGKRAS